MTYVDDVAEEIESRTPQRLRPAEGGPTLFRLYALLALTKGDSVTAEDVHDAWSVWMLDRDPGHRSLRPFGALDSATQAADEPFLVAIKEVARRRQLASA